ncbi:MAG: 23S rRNA (pseudouridine(1915)-N(3))-methyltransferase RlmH [Clostridiales bacterium]|nr:23S rRNA (pseudouridine(1915)-N(3))-methyltransferase RlmH [Clostridiales bacterium]
MKIKIACVGKLKDRFTREAVAEYAKRLSRFCALEIAEVADEKAPESLSAAEETQVLQREGERLLGRILPGEFVVCLAVGGKRMDSETFARTLQSVFDRGASCVTFVIGGSLGLSPRVLNRADLLLSLSDMTLPHGLCRAVLSEQIYRAFKINAHEPYHK